MLYERAGNQYVGRILSGMNVLSPKFGAGCPDFFRHGAAELCDGPEQVVDAKQLQDQITSKVSHALASCFGDLGPFVAIRKTLQYGLVSLLHHIEMAKYHHGANGLTNDCPDNCPSPLNLLPVFRNKEEILGLKDYVRVIYPWDSDKSLEQCIMRLTGIPPHVGTACTDQAATFATKHVVIASCIHDTSLSFVERRIYTPVTSPIDEASVEVFSFERSIFIAF
jgi:hypothetical protein